MSDTPQLENGYTKIANEIMDALIKVPIGNANAQILYAILRKTYGWNKKSDQISISQLEKITECSRRTVIYALQNLESKRMIIIKRSRGRGIKNEINEISFNKKYQEWVVQEKSDQYNKVLKQRKEFYRKSKRLVVQEIVSSARNGNLVVQETEKNSGFLAPTKETSTKENIQKKINKAQAPDWLDLNLWNDFLEHRKKLRKPMTEKAKEIFFLKLTKLKDKGFNPTELIETAIERGWQSVFEPQERKENGIDTFLRKYESVE